MEAVQLETRPFIYAAPKLHKWSIFWILLLLCIYEGLIQYFQPKGFSFLKILIASAMLTAFFLLVRIAWARIQHRTTFSFFVIAYYTVYLVYCLITVLRSFEPDIQVIANLFGTYTTGLGLLVPVFALAGDRLINHDILLRSALKLIWVGIALTPLGLVEGRLALFASPFVQLSYLLLPFWFYISPKQRQVVIIGLIASLFVSLFTNVRSVMMRELLLIGCLWAFYTLRQKSIVTIIAAVVAIMAVFTLTLYADDISKLFLQREIDVFGIKIDNDQNRTWMYEEVYDDLSKKGDLLYGRGPLGKYFSAFFFSVYQSEGASADDYNRYNIEVGILSYLLKGGYLLLWSTLGLLLTAGFLGLVKANSPLVKGMGIVLLCHVVGMSVENYPKLAAYDVIIWLYVGTCLSISMRANREPFQPCDQPARPLPVQRIKSMPVYQATI